jgi:hypothetical protein
MKKHSIPRLPILVLTCAMLAGAVPALAEKDFLTEAEIEKVREAQAPSDRLKLYVVFARQRIDQLQRLLGKEKKGRSAEARELLEDYAEIIDAIDTVADDALRRSADAAEGTTAVVTAEKRFLGQLQQIKDRNLADAGLFEVALREAIASTSDSIAQAGEDATGRGAKLAEADKRQKKEAEETLAAEDRKGKPEEAKDGDKSTDVAKADDGKPRRKPPTLLKPGEKLPDEK